VSIDLDFESLLSSIKTIDTHFESVLADSSRTFMKYESLVVIESPGYIHEANRVDIDVRFDTR
jgi:hypothetical protein